MEEELGEMTEENEQSASVLSQLESAGEDVGDAQNIVNQRKGQIQEYQNRIRFLMDSLRQ